MKRFLQCLGVGAILVILAATVVVAASAIDTHIKNLKSKDPEVRAKAAYELGCG